MMLVVHSPHMLDYAFWEELHASDRLRLLVDEVRRVGAHKGLLTALDHLADKLEVQAEPEDGNR